MTRERLFRHDEELGEFDWRQAARDVDVETAQELVEYALHTALGNRQRAEKVYLQQLRTYAQRADAEAGAAPRGAGTECRAEIRGRRRQEFHPEGARAAPGRQVHAGAGRDESRGEAPRLRRLGGLDEGVLGCGRGGTQGGGIFADHQRSGGAGIRGARWRSGRDAVARRRRAGSFGA